MLHALVAGYTLCELDACSGLVVVLVRKNMDPGSKCITVKLCRFMRNNNMLDVLAVVCASAEGSSA